MTQTLDAEQIKRLIAAMFKPGQVFELRSLDATTARDRLPYDKPRTITGFFNDVEKLIAALPLIASAQGIYITVNPVPPDLLAHTNNRLRDRKVKSVSDEQIIARQWILLDLDPERANHITGIPANERESQTALTLAQEIRDALTQDGWPLPIETDSGNGAYLLYAVDLPANDNGLVQRVLAGLAKRFDTDQVHIDLTTFNQSRIMRLCGTKNTKGDGTAERPHRLSRLLAIPDEIQPVPQAMLETVATPIEQPQDKKEQPSKERTQGQGAKDTTRNGRDFSLEDFISRHTIDYVKKEAYQGGTKYLLAECPFCKESDHNAILLDMPYLVFSCSHNRCKGKYKWQDFRLIFEPDAYDKKKRPSSGQPSYGHEATDEGRACIILGGQDREARDASLQALELANQDKPVMFVQLANLSNVGKDKNGRPILQTVGVHEMKNALTDCADFIRIKIDKKTEEEKPVNVQVPQNIAELILSLSPHKWPFPPLEAIVEVPVLRPDGTILDTPGYDEATQLYYAPSEDMKRCKVKLHPTREDVTAAKQLIIDAIGQFPYESEADFANAVGTCLTPLIRHIIKGDVQMALVDATKPGTGKGLLADFICVSATGKQASPTKLSESDEELEKRIIAKLREGATTMVIDNITRKITSAILELALTRRTFDGRILGQSKMVQVINRATWIATGNNIQLGGDMARRCYRIRLVSPVSNPDERDDFKIKDLAQWIEEHRPDVVAALLTMVRAWFVAGKPKAKKVPNLGTFTDWAKTVGGILEYAGISGFQENRAGLKAESNVEEGQWEAFFLAWESIFGESENPIGKIVEKVKEQTADNFAGSPNQLPANPLFEALPDTLKFALQEKPTSFSMKLAKSLEKRVKTPYGIHNIRVDQRMDKNKKQVLWKVMRVVAGSYSPPYAGEKISDTQCNNSHADNVKTTGDTTGVTTRNYPQPDKDEKTESGSDTTTGRSTEFSSEDVPLDFAGSPLALPANEPDRIEQALKSLHVGQTVNTPDGWVTITSMDSQCVTVSRFGVPHDIRGAAILLITPRREQVRA